MPKGEQLISDLENKTAARTVSADQTMALEMFGEQNDVLQTTRR